MTPIPNPPNITHTDLQSDINVLPVKKSQNQTLSNTFNSSDLENVDLGILERTVVSHKSIQDVHILISEMFGKMEDNFKKFCAALTTVSLQIQELNVRLKSIKKQNNQHNAEVPASAISNMQRSFPLKTINEVTTFENGLSQNEDEYNKFVLCISRIGGKSAKENLIRIYRTIFSNEVAKESSWKGLRNHFKISSLSSLLKEVQETVSGQHQLTNKEFEDITKEWFQGGQKLSRQQKGSEEVTAQTEHRNY